jgi:hypothetical protein
VSNRLDYYFRQKVTEFELDTGFQYAEDADRLQNVDAGMVGVMYGLVTAAQSIPDLTVKVSGPGAAYDKSGERIATASDQNVDCSKDYLNVSTAVSTPGNEKYLSIFARFTRALSDPRTDGNQITVYFQRSESFTLRIVQGSEAAIGLGVKPSVDANDILLADIHLVNAQVSVVGGDISLTRKENLFNFISSPRSVTRGQVPAAISDLLTYYNNHVNGAADKHPAADINYAGGGNWANGTTNPAASVEAQLDKVISDLAATSDPSGIKKLGGRARVSSFGLNLSAGHFESQVDKILESIGKYNDVVLYEAGTDDDTYASWASGQVFNVSAWTVWVAPGTIELTNGASRPQVVTGDVIEAWFTFQADLTAAVGYVPCNLGFHIGSPAVPLSAARVPHFARFLPAATKTSQTLYARWTAASSGEIAVVPMTLGSLVSPPAVDAKGDRGFALRIQRPVS